MTTEPLLTPEQLVSDDQTERALDPQFTPYKNIRCTKYFESQIIVDLNDAGTMSGSQYFGVVSWKFHQKVRQPCNIRQVITDDRTAHDFYYMARDDAEKNIWQQAEAKYRGGIDFTSYTQQLLKELHFDAHLHTLKTVPSYCNYQICKTELYQDYIVNCLKPMIGFMEDDSRADLQRWLNEDSLYKSSRVNINSPWVRFGHTMLKPLGGYRRAYVENRLHRAIVLLRANGDASSKSRLMEFTGFPYYTKHAFIAERLFPTYAAIKGWKGKRFD